MNRNAIILMLMSLCLFSCGKDTGTGCCRLCFDGVVAYSPQYTSPRDKTSVSLFVFPDRGDYLTVAGTASGWQEFDTVHDTTYEQLKRGEITTCGGETITALYSGYYNEGHGMGEIDADHGDYFVVMVSAANDSPGIYRKGYAYKYATKHISTNNESMLFLGAAFPNDFTRYGLIPWTETDGDFPYTFGTTGEGGR